LLFGTLSVLQNRYDQDLSVERGSVSFDMGVFSETGLQPVWRKYNFRTPFSWIITREISLDIHV